MQLVNDSSPIKIATERLVLQDIHDQDIFTLYQILSNEEVKKYNLFNNLACIRDQLIEAVECTKDKPRCDFSFSVFIKETGSLIGQVFVNTHPANVGAIIGWEFDSSVWDGNQFTDPGREAFAFLNNSVAQIGWNFDPKYWKHGYATEAAKGAISFSFSHLAVEGVIAQCFSENTASRRVMEKNGMKLQQLTLWQQKQIQRSYQVSNPIVSYAIRRSHL